MGQSSLTLQPGRKRRGCARGTVAALGLAAFGFGAPAAAAPMEEVSRLCSQGFARAERENGIPKHLVQAVAMTESGRWSDKAGTVVAWPWTINAQGQGHYFETMHEAVTFARNLQMKGVTSMDVGCMQVNLKHHPDAFVSLTDAFNPAKNVAYGAKFLRQNYDELGNWHQAVAAYHSRTPQKGRQYYANVRRNWQRALGGPVEYASLDSGVVVRGGNERPDSGISERNRRFEISVKDGEHVRSMKSSRRSSRDSDMKVIQVGKKDTASPEVLVIRPVRAEVTVAHGQAEDTPFISGRDKATPVRGAETLLAAKESGALVKRVSSRQKGPNFIFD